LQLASARARTQALRVSASAVSARPARRFDLPHPVRKRAELMSDDQTTETHVSDLLKLVASGLDVDAAAKRLGLTASQAARQLAHDTARLRSDLLDPEGDRVVERVHLDMLRRALLPLALSGDIGAARLLVRIHTARALLLGLLDELPVIDVEPGEDVTELDKLRARRRARREATS
jgi:hypothetical protein